MIPTLGILPLEMTAAPVDKAPATSAEKPRMRGASEPASTWRRVGMALLLAVVPGAALGELVVGEAQRKHVPTREQWQAAADAARAARKPGDVVVVAPRWAEQHGRMAMASYGTPHLDAIAPPGTMPPLDAGFDVHVAARADLETAARVLELSIRGKDDPQTKGWTLEKEQRFGDVALRILDNPRPQKLLRDLADEIDPTAVVSRVGPAGVDRCRWEEGGAPRMPTLFGGPIMPVRHFLCTPYDPGWSWVGPTVITDLDYVPRRCIFMHPHEANVTTVELPPKKIGKRVVAYLGLHVYQERELGRAPVFARITVGGHVVATTTHPDGAGWQRFEGSTESMAGTDQPVKLEVWVDRGLSQFRTACLAAQIRE